MRQVYSAITLHDLNFRFQPHLIDNFSEGHLDVLQHQKSTQYGMSTYDADYPPKPRQRGGDAYPRPTPYPASVTGSDVDDPRPRQARFDSNGGGQVPLGQGDLPPPPMGDALNRRPSAMKREGSRSRVPHLKPEFPDEASYLGSNAPDLERKNRRRDKAFREKRDGYESDEGEVLRKDRRSRQHLLSEDEFADEAPRRPRVRDDRHPLGAFPVRGDRPLAANSVNDPPSRQDSYDGHRRRKNYDGEPHRPRRRDDYDDVGPPRHRDDYYDDRAPPRRRDDYNDYDEGLSRRRNDRPVEYGSAPIPARRATDAGRSRPRRRRDDYDDYSDPDEDYRPRRPRSHEDGARRRRADPYDDRYYDSDDRETRRRRGEDRDSRRRYDDDYDDYDRYDRRDRDRRDRRRPPRKIEIGGYDIGPLVEKGQKHYSTVAPFVTPLVLNMAKKYLANGGR